MSVEMYCEPRKEKFNLSERRIERSKGKMREGKEKRHLKIHIGSLRNRD